jgi:hypothetical protein
LILVGLVSLIAPSFVCAADPPPFALKDGDRVVLLGDTFIEREQKYGYLETLLTLQNNDKNIVFRNLGWSGDTVFGHARAGFGTQPDGYKHLKEHVHALKPTVIFVGYGMSESFEGKSGLAAFTRGYNALLDTLNETKARIVLLSPIRHEKLPPPLPDPAPHNASLASYVEAIGDIAAKRNLRFVNLFEKMPEKQGPSAVEALTDDGVQLTETGYWIAAQVIGRELGVNVPRWAVRGSAGDRALNAEGAQLGDIKWTAQGVDFRANDARLPYPLAPLGHARDASLIDRSLRIGGLDTAGFYTLKIDGKRIDLLNLRHERILNVSADDLERGAVLLETPERAQAEQLRKTINEKNLLYFHRWRPQNETYLFGFRKHEQGNNAREIPLFDPLVEAREKEIARLRTPVSHRYEITKQNEVAR